MIQSINTLIGEGSILVLESKEHVIPRCNILIGSVNELDAIIADTQLFEHRFEEEIDLRDSEFGVDIDSLTDEIVAEIRSKLLQKHHLDIGDHWLSIKEVE